MIWKVDQTLTLSLANLYSIQNS